MLDRPAFLALALALALPAVARADDPLHDLQDVYGASYAKDPKEARSRAYHFGSQGPGGVFANSQGHSNRLIPFYTFGKKLDPSAVTGSNSVYRDADRLKKLYGQVPPHTLNPSAEYCDQSDLAGVMRKAVDAGVKHLFIVWFDGLDWDTTRAAAVYKTGKTYDEGKGSGLVFQDDDAGGSARFGYYVTSPTHDKNTRDADAQTVKIDGDALPGGYDPEVGGPNPWTPGKLLGTYPFYLKGAGATKEEKARIKDDGRALHAVTDSAPSAGEFVSGVKSFNDGINVDEDGRFLPTLFHTLQSDRHWKVGTVTSVPFDHASPAAMYAHNVERDDYQDLARDMLGLKGIAQESGKDQAHPGLDVVLGGGYGIVKPDADLKAQGKNAALGQNVYLADDDKQAIDVKNGGKYVVAERTPDAEGARVLADAAERAAGGGHRLFGFFGAVNGHLPYRTADGDYRPARGYKGTAEAYSEADLKENPTLADMTRAALAVLSAEPDRPFALFVEAGDVDFALHDNNLDNAIGAVFSGEDAIRVIIKWVESRSNWDESAMIVTADHGHYLVVDDPEALRAARGTRAE